MGARWKSRGVLSEHGVDFPLFVGNFLSFVVVDVVVIVDVTVDVEILCGRNDWCGSP